MTWRDAVRQFHEPRNEQALEPDWEDLEYLAGLLEQRQPKRLLEYGSGCSTALFKWYTNQSGAMGLSLENDPLWFNENTRGLWPISGRWRIVSSPIVSGRSISLRYGHHPSEPFDFVYVDGPWLVVSADYVSDVLDIRPFPRTMVVDGRVSQTAVMQALLGGEYDIELDNEHSRATFLRKENNG